MAEPLAPGSTLPYPPIHEDKKFVVLSDWLVGLLTLMRLPESHASFFHCDLIGMGQLPHSIQTIVCAANPSYGQSSLMNWNLIKI